LPVAQYALVTNRITPGSTGVASTTESGTVAGVSTDAPVATSDQTTANSAVQAEHVSNGDTPTMVRYASIDQCISKRDLDLAQLEAWNTQMQKYYLDQFNNQVYVKTLTAQLNDLTLTQVQRNDIRTALDQMRQTYGVDSKLANLKKAVDQQRASILSRTCNE
jgi:hypothetical protein